MKRVSIFGATGSIGQNTLDLIGRDRGAYSVVALTGGRNVALLAQQARDHAAQIAVIAEDSLLGDLRDALAGSGIAVAAGSQALIEAAGRPADWIMSAIVGAAGLPPGLKALEHGTTLALANKESLVTAGALLLKTARQYGATIVPVDSEHSGVFQALTGEDIATVERVIITASGGAFRDWSVKDMAQATVEQAGSHPNWDMGQRITIDSASLFNKALELIETKEYFCIDPDKIETVIHPESIIHAMVGFQDGGIMAHLGPADMRHAIGYALHWPTRAHVPVERLDFAKLAQLSFRAPDEQKYPSLRLARQVMSTGGLAGAVFNGAKERALDAFIDRDIGFCHMADVVETVMNKMTRDGLEIAEIGLDEVRAADQAARRYAVEAISAL